MKTIRTYIGRFLLVVAACMLVNSTAWSAKNDAMFSTTPKLNGDTKWRIGYYEGGPYVNYVQTLEATINGLMKLGWVKRASLPDRDGESTEKLWSWLATEAESDYIEFIADAHYSANWDEKLRPEVSAKALDRMQTKNDIDLLIAMGTWAGKDFANDQHGVPTMVMSTSDPLSSGIIKSIEDSGFDHVHARVDPDRFKRQVTVFHEIARFKKLGLAYEDSEDGRTYAALDDVRAIGKARGFEVVECHTVSDVANKEEAEESVVSCMEKLAKISDAIYVTQQGGVTKRSIPRVVDIANEHHVPTFSQSGPREVRLGIMVSLSRAGYRYVGEFHADTIARVFNGAKPNQLEQVFEEPPKVAINLRTAELVGFDPPVVLLGAADEIFQEIPKE